MNLFIGDPHFGHAKIIGYVGRPFADVGEMDRTIIANWNAVVGPDDHVYVLGDFCWGGAEKARSYLSRLSGHKHLVFGNHDKQEVRELDLWESASDYMELHDGPDMVCLFHYPCRAWNRSHHGSYGLFGHMHGAFEPINRSIDVGVDVFDYRPVTLAQIKKRLQSLKLDNHPKTTPKTVKR